MPPGTQIMAIVKADAYGLGASCISEIVRSSVDALGVVSVSEARVLQQGGYGLPIMVFSEPLPTESIEDLVRDPSLIFVVYSLAFADRLSKIAAAYGCSVAVHIKLNTGLNRLGISAEASCETIRRVSQYPGLKVTGLLTHLGFADVPLHPETARQIQIFDRLLSWTKQYLGYDVQAHVFSTFGLVSEPQRPVYDLVRIGYGLYENAVHILAPVGYVHTISPGEWVSYSGLYRADHPHQIVVVYAGYSAGIPTDVVGMEVMFHGKRYPVVGRVCMDLLMVAMPLEIAVSAGDEVYLYGGQGDAAITAQDWMNWASLAPREIFCRFGYRAGRIDICW